tara:strand:+ start:176 stop:463 length:288 start_codon:yes stop_codon:yes gene_type:complete
MLYEKIALVIIFLAVLFAAQMFLYKRYKFKPNTETFLQGLRLHSRLSLSKNDQVNIVSAGSDKFLIVSSKNSSATIIALNNLSSADIPEEQLNEI